MENKQNDLSGILSQLKNAGQDGRRQAANQMIAGLNSEQTKQLGEIIKDKGKLNELLNSAAARQIMEKLGGNGNGQHQ